MNYKVYKNIIFDSLAKVADCLRLIDSIFRKKVLVKDVEVGGGDGDDDGDDDDEGVRRECPQPSVGSSHSSSQRLHSLQS